MIWHMCWKDANVQNIRKMVVDSLDEYPELTVRYALPWVERKGTSIEEWKKFTETKGNKFDELALFIFALATKRNIGIVFQDDSYWTTSKGDDLQECEIIFLYMGNLTFERIETSRDRTKKRKWWKGFRGIV